MNLRTFPLDFNRPFMQIPITFVGFVAFLLNAILLAIICRVKVEGMGKSFKFLLFLYTFIALVSVSILVLLLPVLIPSRNGAYMVNTVVRFHKKVTRVLLCVWVACYNAWFIVLSYSFLCRCLSSQGRQHLKYVFNRFGIFLLVILAVVGATTSPIYILMMSSQPKDEICLFTAESMSGHNATELSFIGEEYYNRNNSFGTGMYMTTTVLFTLLPFILLMIVCIILFWRFHKRNSAQGHISAMTLEMHARLFRMLILQTVTPFVFSYIPPFVVYALALLKITLRDEVNYTIASFFFVAQILDPIIVVTFVKTYRTAVFFKREEKART